MNDKCPTCGRFISKDLMEKVNMQATIKKLEKDLNDLRTHNKELSKVILDKDKLQRENEALVRSNKLLDDELKRVRSYAEDLEHKIDTYVFEIDRLKNRGLFDRIFNK